MKNSDVKIGDHCWAMSVGRLLVVLKIHPEYYDVCGAWECGIHMSDLNLLELIPKPIAHINTPLYYE
jgi:hypothetical protein